MNQFLELFEGSFSNKRQAQSHPTRYAHIRVQHRKISDYRFYGEQAYNYLLNRPYRQFVIEVVDEGDYLRLKNYEIKDAIQFAECKNLELLTDDLLTYRPGCDNIIRQTGPKRFEGKNDTCECWVMRGTIKTYVQNEVVLTENEYQVLDRGLHAETHAKIWGSDWGAFNFVRLPL
jgi:CpeT protein